MKIVYRILRSLLVAIIALAVLVPLASYVALSLTPVQQSIARRAEAELSRMLDSRVTIGNLGIVPFNRLVLRNVTVETTPGDTLLTARRLGAGIRIGSLLTDDPLTITYVELIGMDGRLHRATKDSPLNLERVIRALRSRKKGDKPTPFDLKINTVLIRASRISYDVDSAAMPEPGRFSPDHIAVSDLRADITLPRLRNNDFAAEIKRMAFTGPAGMRVDAFSALAALSDERLRVANVAVTLPHSNLQLADMEIPLTGINSLPKALHTARLSVSVTPGSRITPADFSSFAPALAGMTMPVAIERLAAEGNLDEFSAHVKLTQADGLLVRADADARSLSDPETRRIDLKDLEINVSSRQILYLADAFASPGALSPSLQRSISRLEFVRLDAAATLEGKNFTADADLTTAAGAVTAEAEGDYAGAKDFSVTGSAETAGLLALGAMLPDDPSAGFDGSVEGSYSVSGRRRAGEMTLRANRLNFRSATYTDFTAEATLADEVVRMNLEIDNPDLSAQLSGSWGLSKTEHQAAIDGTIFRFNPSALHLSSFEPGADYAVTISADFAGPQLDHMAGHAELSHLTMTRPDGSSFQLRDFSLASDSAGVTLTSDLLDGRLTGSYSVPRLLGSVKSILSGSQPALTGAAAEGAHSAVNPSAAKGTGRNKGAARNSNIGRNNFDFTFRVKECDAMARFFNLPVSAVYPIDIKGYIRDAEGEMAVELDAPYLRQGNKVIEATRLEASATPKATRLNLTTKAPTQKGFLNLRLNADGGNDNILTTVDWNVERERAYNGHVEALSSFSRAPGGNLLSRVDLRRSRLTFNDSTWTVNPATIEANGSRYIRVDGINVHRNNQYVKINGTIAETDDALLTLDLLNFNLDYLFESLGIDKVMLGGDATGTFYASHLFDQVPYLETPGLSVSDISYNKVVLGDALVKSHWDAGRKAITLDAAITEEGRRSYVDGAIFPMADSLDISFRVDHVDVAFMQPYMEAFASDIHGHASGECRLWGSFKYIDLEGDVFADDLSMKINFTNTTYTARDSVHFRPGLIDLNGITIRDVEGHTADLNGYVKHKFFKEPEFKFSLTNARNFLSYNETSRDNPVWYGKIYGDGSAYVSGVPGRVDISVDMATAPNSVFTFVLSDQEVAEAYSFLTFRDKNRASAEMTDTIVMRDTSMELVNRLRSAAAHGGDDSPSDYNISLQMRVTPQAQLILVMDPVGGDRIRAWGSGHLRMDYGSANNDLRMYGTYTLDRGSYNFTLQDVIIKDFTIRQGSQIVFNGDPYAAQLNIQATYALNANLSDLDESFLTDKELTRTKVPVHALMKVMGDIRQPEIAFDLEFPTLSSDVYRKVRSIVSTDDMMNRQIIYLLALNRFYTPEYMSATTKGNELVSVASSTISSQISNLLGQISDNWNIAPTFRSDRGDFSDMEFDLALSSRLLNNRLLFNGNFGYRDNDLNTNQFIGDFDLEYLLDREGRWRLKAYNRYNDQNYYLRTAKTTQGIGVVLKLDFDRPFRFIDFFRRKLRKNK